MDHGEIFVDRWRVGGILDGLQPSAGWVRDQTQFFEGRSIQKNIYPSDATLSQKCSS